MDSFFSQSRLILAHRGASKAAPENTLAAFRRAAELGADGIELDVQLSADGVPVVLHDLHLARVAGLDRKVSELPLAELQKLDGGRWFAPEFEGEPIPTLAEVFETFGAHLRYNVELKTLRWSDRGLARAVVQTIRRYRLEERVLLSSFNLVALLRVRRLAPELLCGFLTAPRMPPWMRWLGERFRWDALHPNFSMLSQERVQKAHGRGLKIVTWTVNDPQTAQQLFDWGVDAIITDEPGAI